MDGLVLCSAVGYSSVYLEWESFTLCCIYFVLSLSSCSFSSPQRWVFTTISTPLWGTVTGEQCHMFPLFLSFFPHYATCICSLEVKPLESLFQDTGQNKACHIKSPCKSRSEDKTPTPVHFQRKAICHEIFMIYASQRPKHILRVWGADIHRDTQSRNEPLTPL